jgi:hypothetical protein
MKRSTIIWILAVALVASVLVELVLDMGDHADYPWWHQVIGVQAAYGLLGCCALIFVAKFLAKIGFLVPEPPSADPAPYDPADPAAAVDAGTGPAASGPAAMHVSDPSAAADSSAGSDHR